LQTSRNLADAGLSAAAATFSLGEKFIGDCAETQFFTKGVRRLQPTRGDENSSARQSRSMNRLPFALSSRLYRRAVEGQCGFAHFCGDVFRGAVAAFTRDQCLEV
jgi:hypothetical protein